jgi:hypothetical protein
MFPRRYIHSGVLCWSAAVAVCSGASTSALLELLSLGLSLIPTAISATIYREIKCPGSCQSGTKRNGSLYERQKTTTTLSFVTSKLG